jgi:hypothetical protein
VHADAASFEVPISHLHYTAQKEPGTAAVAPLPLMASLAYVVAMPEAKSQ